MKMKLSFVLLVCLMASFANATVYITGSGDWTNASIWSTGVVPPTTLAEEIKLCSAGSDTSVDGMVVTVSTNVGNYTSTSCKIGTVRDTTLQVVAGGYIGSVKEINIGKSDASGSGTDNGYLVQTGGQIDITGSGKLSIGFKPHAVGTDGGVYTISGGSLTGSAGRLYVGCNGGAGALGKVIVDGTGASINLGGTMYIANDSETANNYTGNGTLQFKLNSSGDVSTIHVAKSVIDSQNSSAAIASLLVDATNGVPTTTIVLVENTGTSAVVGLFDSLNGGSAAEGATVVLGGTTFTLTYQYAAGADAIANDIALVIPEPATLSLIGLGLLAIRRRK